jgi:hypothetical protein
LFFRLDYGKPWFQRKRDAAIKCAPVKENHENLKVLSQTISTGTFDIWLIPDTHDPIICSKLAHDRIPGLSAYLEKQ